MYIGCARVSELGADDGAEADGIISGFRCRRVYPRPVLSRRTATVLVGRSVIIPTITGTASTIGGRRGRVERPETATQGNKRHSVGAGL